MTIRHVVGRRDRAAAALGVALLIAGTGLIAGCSTSGSGAASCADLIRYHEGDYLGLGAPGELEKVDLGEKLGHAVRPGCNDTNDAAEVDTSVQVYRVQGLTPEQGVAVLDGDEEPRVYGRLTGKNLEPEAAAYVVAHRALPTVEPSEG